jgi:hypothetical protein
MSGMKNQSWTLISILIISCLICIPLVFSFEYHVSLFGGESKEVVNITNCSAVFVNVTGSRDIHTAEYWFDGCTQIQQNTWNCTCTDRSFDVRLSTKSNTLNEYNLTINSVLYLYDNDKDGYPENIDCNDSNASIYPGAREICNGVDDNCNGNIDEGACKMNQYYCDRDGDGYTSSKKEGQCKGYNCIPQGCSTSSQKDCNDNNLNIYQGAPELCNGIDDDCDGKVDENACITAMEFCRSHIIKGTGSKMQCIYADWKKNEINPFANDCMVQKVNGEQRCVATNNAN